MVFTFDFIDFAEKIAGGKYVVKDAWGHDVDIRSVEMILTTSMLKLWNCYDSMEHYLSCCEQNHYTFGVPKTCPKELENWRSLNYQFIQSYHLTDEQIDELISPTIHEIEDVIAGDYRKALIFLRGMDLNDDNVEVFNQGLANSMMIDPRTFDDPFIKKKIFQLIERRIKNAKIGVIGVHGNYSILCGDPFALCQSIFSLPVTGLLMAGEIYNKYWLDSGVEKVACFRAPMSTHENIAAMRIADSDDMRYWYQYMTTCTMTNAWDTLCQKLNGADKDGDIVFLTDNRILVDNIRPMPAIFCVQRKGDKKVVTEDDLVQANIASFGDDIGKTTNYITAMYDVQAQFEPGSPEYETLAYRIKSGQLFQQNCIDKAKGIACKPMPRHWYDYRAANALPENPTEEDIARRDFNLRILADKKPYFMRYIYPAVMKDYNTYIKRTEDKCFALFAKLPEELASVPVEERTERMSDFLHYYFIRIPVGINNCVMNRICRKVEHAFGVQVKRKITESNFDYSILKSGVSYKKSQYQAISKLYAQHKKDMQEYNSRAISMAKRVDELEYDPFDRENFVRRFAEQCLGVCSDGKVLCEIMLDICYKREGTKQFVWDVCAAEILLNLLDSHDNMISYPIRDDNGEIVYSGERFSMRTIRSQIWAK